MKSKDLKDTYEGNIYIIKNDINTKLYIGQTIRSIEDRYKSHLSEALGNLNKTPKMYISRAIRKHGADHFWCELLEKIYAESYDKLREKLDAAEIAYISQYNSLRPNGYNVSRGGNTVGVDNGFPVYVANQDGDVIEVFRSMLDGAKNYGVSMAGIWNAVRSESHYCAGVYWYLNDDHNIDIGDNIGKQRPKNIREVYQFDLEGNLLARFDSIKEAADKYGLNRSAISGVCRLRSDTLGGYRWSYTKDLVLREKKEPKKRGRHVDQYDMNWNYIATFESLSDAAKAVNGESGNIWSCCNDRHEYAYGYKWKYHEDSNVNNEEVVANG